MISLIKKYSGDIFLIQKLDYSSFVLDNVEPRSRSIERFTFKKSETSDLT